MLTTGPRGTNDILPSEVHNWLHVESLIRRISHRYGYAELRPPVFEHTELFEHGTGTTTDIVEREMYSFVDRGDRRVTLRPEFTPGLVRAFLEHKLYAQPQPTKVISIGPCFRYERPQKGRFRQFHQWDVEVFGSQDPAIDAEVIYIGMDLAGQLGITGLEVHLNSIGCPKCRPIYRERLRDHFRPNLEKVCDDCKNRFERNPLRLLDCKTDECQPFRVGAPRMIDNLCDECKTHFDGVLRNLEALGATAHLNPNLVRGLDYYTKTVFEVISPSFGEQSTLWGGGRYDGLIETLGGSPTPGIGFAVGMERLIMVADELGLKFPELDRMDVFVVTAGETAARAALPLVMSLRKAGLGADMDYLGRSLKSQMKYAGKYRARYAAIVGDSELERGVCALKEMDTGNQEEVALTDLVGKLLGGEPGV